MKLPVLVALTATLVVGQNYDRLPRLPFPNSPCPLVFNYNQSQPDQNTWLGAVLVSVSTPVHGLRLQVSFSEKASVLASNIGEVWTANNQNFTILDLKRELKPEESFGVWLLVTFGDLVPVPHLQTVELNGKQICPPPIERKIKHDQDEFPSGRQRQQEKNISTNEETIKKDVYDPKDCGRIKILAAKGLILKSELAPYGHFPWHAAFYQYDSSDRTFKYTCGGTLITPSLVVTAGHCVITPGSANNRPLSKDVLLINLGRYTSRATTEDGVQDKRVSEIHVHPLFEFSVRTIKNDIAVIKMSSPATINKLVRPICLWDKDKVDINNVINKYGTVVGWGYEIDNKLTDQLRQAKMPIVGVDTCLYNHPLFYAAYINNYTYCAGSPPTGPTVCNGDSGGGMVFKNNEETPDDEATWHLRGVVSLAAGDSNYRCDPRHYVVFMDVAKYLDWILSFLDEKL